MLEFIVGLEKDYPSTVSTIARTISKLAPKGQSDSKCILCDLYALSTFILVGGQLIHLPAVPLKILCKSGRRAYLFDRVPQTQISHQRLTWRWLRFFATRATRLSPAAVVGALLPPSRGHLRRTIKSTCPCGVLRIFQGVVLGR